jgi:hypothetical protein
MKFGPTYLRHFEGDILVRCPRCAACAHLIKVPEDTGRRTGYRLVCAGCTDDRDWLLERDRAIPWPAMGPHLSGFGLDLWLQVPCCGETLWAFNEPHIDFLERFIAAKVRERDAVAWKGYRNSTLQSSLPRWMQIAKNRKAVSKALEVLRGKLESSV